MISYIDSINEMVDLTKIGYELNAQNIPFNIILRWHSNTEFDLLKIFNSIHVHINKIIYASYKSKHKIVPNYFPAKINTSINMKIHIKICDKIYYLTISSLNIVIGNLKYINDGYTISNFLKSNLDINLPIEPRQMEIINISSFKIIHAIKDNYDTVTDFLINNHSQINTISKPIIKNYKLIFNYGIHRITLSPVGFCMISIKNKQLHVIQNIYDMLMNEILCQQLIWSSIKLNIESINPIFEITI